MRRLRSPSHLQARQVAPAGVSKHRCYSAIHVANAVATGSWLVFSDCRQSPASTRSSQSKDLRLHISAKGISETASTDSSMPSSIDSIPSDSATMSAEASSAMQIDINSMPPELLNRILEHVFVRERQPVLMSLRKQSGHSEADASHTMRAVTDDDKHTEFNALNISLTNKAFYHAGIEAFYTHNTLSLADSDTLNDFIAHIGSGRKKATHAVAVRIKWFIAPPGEVTPQWRLLPNKKEWDQSLDCLAQLPRLRKLIVVVELFVHAYKERFDEASRAVESYIERSVPEAWEREGLEVEVRYEEVREWPSGARAYLGPL